MHAAGFIESSCNADCGHRRAGSERERMSTQNLHWHVVQVYGEGRHNCAGVAVSYKGPWFFKFNCHRILSESKGLLTLNCALGHQTSPGLSPSELHKKLFVEAVALIASPFLTVLDSFNSTCHECSTGNIYGTYSARALPGHSIGFLFMHAVRCLY